MQFNSEQFRHYQEWLHAEKVFDTNVKDSVEAIREEGWRSLWAEREHYFMSTTADLLVDDGSRTTSDRVTVSTESTQEIKRALIQDGQNYANKYRALVQNVFSRVQHHIHKRTKKGIFPLKSCQKKGRKNCATCKHDFPKQTVVDANLPRSLLLCRGVARKFNLRVSGRRNQLGALLGCRSDPWQSGTTPSFAAAFSSNTHTLPNWRLPPSADIHEDEYCRSKKCRESMSDDEH